MSEPQSPGAVLKEMLAERGWSQGDLDDILGCHPGLVNRIARDKRSISPMRAMGLADAFGTTAMFWMETQNKYRLFVLGGGDGSVAKRANRYQSKLARLRALNAELVEALEVCRTKMQDYAPVMWGDEIAQARAAADHAKEVGDG